MGDFAKIAIPVGLGLTGFGLAGVGPLAGLLSAGEGAGAVGAAAADATAAGIGSGGAAVSAGSVLPSTGAIVGNGVNLVGSSISGAPGISMDALTNAPGMGINMGNAVDGFSPATMDAFNQGLANSGAGQLISGTPNFAERVQGLLAPDGMNKVLMNGFQQGLKAMQQPPQGAPRSANLSVQHPGPAQMPLSSFVSMSPYEQQRQRWLASLGRVNT